jgi:adenylate cyclase, class 2
VGSKDTETEVKIKVRDLAEIEKKLRDLNAECKAERVYERNVRYDDANHALSPAGRVLRLRQDIRARLTYKEPKDGAASERSRTRTELEVTVDDFETMDLILKKLGYQPAWIYEKYRTTYVLYDCEVVLDDTPLGAFIEVEGEEDPIEHVLEVLGLSEERRILDSYSVLFFRAKERLKLDVRDMTFENFKNMKVPDEAFYG